MPSLHNVVNPHTRTGRGAYPSIWRGHVVNVTANDVWVRIPTLAADDLTAVNTIPGDLTPGERVVIAAVEGRVDNLVILAKEQPGVTPHLHLHTDIQYPGWAPATLQPPWAAGAGTGRYLGLRYRVDSRHLHLNGTITGGPGDITTLPHTPTYTHTFLAATNTGTTATITVTQGGTVTTGGTGTLHITGITPLD